MTKNSLCCLLAGVLFLGYNPGPASAAEVIGVSIVMNDSEGPEVMAQGGLKELLLELGCTIHRISTVALTEEENRQYGAWNRDTLESRHIGKLVAGSRPKDTFILGLLTNCTDALGMLAGLQHLGLEMKGNNPGSFKPPGKGLTGIKPLRTGLVYIDAHADFNTPETTLSGMLGGMPVAVASGLCLTRLRLKTGLDPALPTKYIVLAGLRDVDPLEQELLDRSQCQQITVQDLKDQSGEIDRQMERLSRLTDLIYVHIDMDVLDPAEVSGHPLTSPEGPTSQELADSLTKMFRHPKAAALGIASLPFGPRDKDGTSLQAAYRLIKGAVLGIKQRPGDSRGGER